MIDRPTPETDQFKIKLKTTCGEKYWVPVEHSVRLERERDDYKWQLHIAKGEVAEARKMERAWKKEETK